MGNAYVASSLDQDLKIFRFISFYDLIDLLTFSRLSFSSIDRMQYMVQHRLIEKKIEPLSDEVSGMDGDNIGSASDSQSEDSLMHQAWILLDRKATIDWHVGDMSQPRIGILSNIRALSESLFTHDAADIFIERTYRVTKSPTQAETLSVRQANTVSVIISATDGSMRTNAQRNGMRLLVDLKTLLVGVIVSPDASIRFLELVSTLVQQTTYASASRASRPSSRARKPVAIKTAPRPKSGT